MAKYCVKCGSLLDVETALCPNCDAEELNRRKRVPRFCTNCGSRLDIDSGLCPQCDADKIKASAAVSAAPAAEEVIEADVANNTNNTEDKVEETAAPEEVKAAEPESVIEQTSAVPENVEPVVEQEKKSEVYVAPVVIPDTTPLETVNTHYVNSTPVKMPVYDKPADYFAPTTFADMPEKKGEKKTVKKKKKASALEVLVTIVLAFSLFVTALLAVASLTARNSVNEKSIETILEDVNGSDVVDVVYGGTSKAFYRNINEYFHTSIDEKDIDRFINRSSAKEDIAKLAATYIEDFVDEDDKFELTTEDIYVFLMRNRDEFEEVSGVYLTSEQAQKLANWLIDKTTEKTIKNFSADSMKDENSSIYDAVRIGLSEGLFIVFVVLSLVWIAAMAKNNLSQAALGTGIVFIIIGGLLTMAAVFAGYVGSLWEMLPLDGFVLSLIGGFLKLNLGTFASVLVSGIALLIGRSVTIKIVEKAKEKKAAKYAR